MDKTVDIRDATVTILVEIEGQVHLVAMGKDEYAMMGYLIKRSISNVVPTKRSQQELIDFLNT